MRETLKRLRIVMVLMLAVFFYRGAPLLGAPPPPESCEDVCPGAPCDTQCQTWVGDEEWFPTCGEYGVCNAEPYCGDGVCQPSIDEDFNTCPDDCPPPPPPPPPPGPFHVLLVNGSFGDPNESWIYPGSDMFNAVRDTYGQDPLPWFWLESDQVFPPYTGIFLGGQQLAAFVSILPEGDVDVVAHSHGGNVAIWATRNLPDRPLRNLIDLATPINFELARHVGGAGVAHRCTASSWEDPIQFLGASWGQIYLFAVAVDLAVHYANLAQDAFDQQDWEHYFEYLALEALFILEADGWWASTKYEWEGPTHIFHNLWHSTMHEPQVWNALVPACVHR